MKKLELCLIIFFFLMLLLLWGIQWMFHGFAGL